jgi:osmotically-inducible protein OsmY
MRRFVVGLAILAVTQLAPSWALGDDSEIAKSIQNQLKAKEDVQELGKYSIQLRVKEGDVLMKGTVVDITQEKLVLGIAARTRGVKKVIDDLHVAKEATAASATPAPKSIAAQPASAKKEAAPKTASTAKAAPASSKAADEKIAKTIFSHFSRVKASGKMENFDFNVFVDKRNVWLKGDIANAEQKKLVLDIARYTPGVLKVVDELKVEAPAAKAVATKAQPKPADPKQTGRLASFQQKPAADDTQIFNAIRNRLAQMKASGQLSDFGVSVISNDGVVWVRGNVTKKEHRDIILDIASRTPGVVKVVNEISVGKKVDKIAETRAPNLSELAVQPRIRPVENSLSEALARTKSPLNTSPKQAQVTRAKTDDQAIVDGIAGKLGQAQSAGRMQGFSIDLHCDEGVVWLRGRVSDPAQHQLALQIASMHPGVRQVMDDLAVIGLNQPAQAANIQPVAAQQPYRVAPMHQPYAMQTRQLAPPSLVNPQYADQTPKPLNAVQKVGYAGMAVLAAPLAMGQALTQGPPAHMPSRGAGVAPARYDHPNMPGYAWPSYASHPNYAAVTYPKQHSPSAWPYIGPFYPYPQVPLGWRKVTLEWDDGWWQLDFNEK